MKRLSPTLRRILEAVNHDNRQALWGPVRSCESVARAAAGNEARQRELNMARDEALKEIKNHE